MENLLFFDIDGTLLPFGQRRVPEDAVRALEQARQAGSGIIINTGRTRVALPQAIRELQPDGYVFGCGTAIYLHGKKLMHRSPPPEVCRRVVRELRRKGIPSIYEADGAVLFDMENFGNRHPHLQSHRSHVEDVAVELREPLPEDLCFEKFVSYGQPHRRTNTLKRVAGEDFEIICREDEMAEVTLKGYSKGTGIHWLAQYLNIPLDRCYAFGDSTNDVEMLRAVKHSVAMGNSMPEILPLCEYVTSDILEGGIARALEHYGLLGGATDGAGTDRQS